MCFFEILVMGVSFHMLYCGWLLPRIYVVKGKCTTIVLDCLFFFEAGTVAAKTSIFLACFSLCP